MVQDEALYKFCLLLFEDPTLKAQPRHEVAVGVGRNEPVAPPGASTAVAPHPKMNKFSGSSSSSSSSS